MESCSAGNLTLCSLLWGPQHIARNLLHALGHRPAVLTAPLAISKAKYPSAWQQTNFFQATLERLRALPGVVSAAAVDSLPLQGGSMQPVQVEGQPVVPMADQPEVGVRSVSPGYLRVMRIPLEKGRDFTDADKAGSRPVVRFLFLRLGPVVAREQIAAVLDFRESVSEDGSAESFRDGLAGIPGNR
jgi:hypothetical protein